MLRISSWRTVFLVFVYCALAAMSCPAQTLATLYSFCSQTNCADGAGPVAALVQGMDGNLYGTTTAYGANGSGGTVFKITTGGGLTTLYSFCDIDGCWLNGATPVAPLVLATNGDFYGTTEAGGAYGPAYWDGGTVFKIASNGTFTRLYSFCAETNCTDGNLPLAGLVQATNGDLYGTTEVGGTNSPNCVFGGLYSPCGTIFKVTPSGAFTSLYSFCAQTGCPDGQFPSAGLIQGSNGDLYGTTALGGAYLSCSFDDVPAGCGTIFKITPGGALTTLHSFDSTDGAEPDFDSSGAGALVLGSDGNFYGTTYFGGTCNNGTVFKITPAGAFKSLYSFGAASGCLSYPNGQFPNAGLVEATDGNVYGTAANVIFKITPKGVVTTVYTFCSEPNCTDGNGPAGLVQATNGDLYGVTGGGGANNAGTVFSLSLSPPLGPFVETIPTSGKAGTKVTILGNNLAGATSVSFNGTPAPSFKVNSTGTAITTTMPSGATTGYVQVTTANGTTLTSNVKFRVL